MESSSTRRETRRQSIEQPPKMSSSSDPMTERLQCSICLEVFSDPVSTPCGHNFCKICLSTYWNNSQDCRCPNCKETFKQRPDLKINTTLRDVVDEHKKKCHEEQAEVVCDICSEGKLKAVKSCLVCQSSYCETHLEPHLRVSGLQKHKLMDPVKNLQDYICQKHDRPLELFCRDDQTCVCLICTVTDHKNHNTVPLREEKHQKHLSRLQKSSSDGSFKFWFLVVGLVLCLLSACLIQVYKDMQRREAETLERVETSKTEITELKKRINELDLDMRSCKAGDVALDPDVSLSLSVKPQKVGVFVDYEEGLVSFYDVENRSHIYSFTDQSFTEKLYPYCSLCFNDKGKNPEPLIITPVNYDQ
ncbi:E3 ubiquitin-protein ligase TRIM47-like [Triplophysa rosa]|uniref:E3 ubiquitin-protein ligase TRIM47-like n=1 Tax=Triplophysa rosa TaxID=992332 RepID=UPI00254612A2|nr:E3 ubiquitin-protein ligase TRIM47-like [Triplophysa rosa]